MGKIVTVVHPTIDGTGTKHWHGFVYPEERHTEALRKIHSLGSNEDMEHATGFGLLAACEVAKKMRDQYFNIQNGTSEEPGKQEQPKKEDFKRS